MTVLHRDWAKPTSMGSPVEPWGKDSKLALYTILSELGSGMYLQPVLTDLHGKITLPSWAVNNTHANQETVTPFSSWPQLQTITSGLLHCCIFVVVSDAISLEAIQ